MKTTSITSLFVLIALVAQQPAAGGFTEDFNSGHSAGELVGQNAWTDYYGFTGLQWSSTNGKGASGGLAGSADKNGAQKPHGVTLDGQTQITLSFDAKVADGARASFDLRSFANVDDYVFSVTVDNNSRGNGDLIRVDLGAGPAGLTESIDITEQWYTGEVVWNVGTDVTFTVFDESSIQVGQITNADNTSLAPDTFDNIVLWNPAGAANIDNLSVTAVGGLTSTFAWKLPGLGNWNSANSWNPGGIPNGNHDAIFGGAIMAPSTVTTDADVTVRSIEFDNSHGYAIAGQGSVNLAQGSNPNVTIDVDQGSHQFQAVVNLHNTTLVNVAGSSKLSFNNVLNFNGNSLTKTGYRNTRNQ